MKAFLFVSSTVLLLISVLMPQRSTSQVVLNADGPGNTYELINSVLAPGNIVVEAPDQCASHPTFGRHITEVFDATLNQHVFEFYAHVTPDNDRCINFDRQRTEIKTYEPSPANLKGTLGETITYKWKFKVPVGFQPSSSFTHIHQVKAVGGDDDDPIFTLTARKGTPNKLELIYVATSASSSSKVSIVNLSLFEGVWVEATEIIKVGANGSYSMVIKRVSDGNILLSYSNANIATIRPDNDFLRPKWGIYRSLNSPADLRDEVLSFANFSIAEGVPNPQAYYWTGGAGIKNFSDDFSWNTALNGTGSSRSLLGPKPEDVFIFDGSNIGGITPMTGAVTLTVENITIAQIRLQNNVTVFLQRSVGGGGTGIITIGGDGTVTPDFDVASGSAIMLNSPNADGAVNIALSANATGVVGGSVTIANTGAHRITSQVVNGLQFVEGSVFHSDGIPVLATYPFGSSSQSVNGGVIFKSGASLIVTGNKSPFGNVSTFQACNMMPASNFYLRTSNLISSGSWTNLKSYGNIFVQNNAAFTADGPFYKLENITIDNGATLTVHSSGNTPVLGDILVNGNLIAPSASTNVIVLGGGVKQIISGTGNITLPNITIANHSFISLEKIIKISNNFNVYGELSFGMSGQITGTGSFTTRIGSTATAVTGNTIAGSYLVTGIVGTLSGNAGLGVTGSAIDTNTNVIGFSSSNAVFNLSKAALVTATNVALSFNSDTAALVINNPNGMDSISGCVVTTGNKTFQSGTHYTVNENTSWPFGISTNAPSVMTVGKVIINAFVRTNYNINIRNGLFVHAGNFTVRLIDTVHVFTVNASRFFTPLMSATVHSFKTSSPKKCLFKNLQHDVVRYQSRNTR